MPYRLSDQAKDDLIDIFLAGALEFGEPQAERYHDGLQRAFAFLSNFPESMRERTELRPPVRLYNYRAHVVVYLLDNRGVRILRIRSAREDWPSDPAGTVANP